MFLILKGLVAIAQQLNGLGSSLEPFPPGTFEEYSLAADGTTKFIRREVFCGVGDRPAFVPFVLYEGNVFGVKLIYLHTILHYTI